MTQGASKGCMGGRGPSSFWMQSPDLVFDALDIDRGERVLDLGCGAGDYAVKAAHLVGEKGRIDAVDHWPPIVAAMSETATMLGLDQIRAIEGDIIHPPLPLEDNAVDHCLLFTVLHIFDLETTGARIFREVARVLKPGGCLAVLECKKEEMPFGPPIQMRLAPKEVESALFGNGFIKTGYRDLGYNYLIRFHLE